MSQQDDATAVDNVSGKNENADPATFKPSDLFTDQQISDMFSNHLAISESDGIVQPEVDPITEPERAIRKISAGSVCTVKADSVQLKNKSTKRKSDDYSTPIKRLKYPKSCLANLGKLYSSDGSSYIKRRQCDDPKNGVLLYSGRFSSGGVSWKLHGDSALLTSANRYIAQVTIRQVDQLDCATDFQQAKNLLDQHLRVDKVFLDEQLQDMQTSRRNYETYLDKICNDTVDNLQHAEDLFQLHKILPIVGNDSRKLFEAIKENWFISYQTKSVIAEYAERESKIASRNNFFKYIQSMSSTPKDGVEVLRRAVEKGLRTHRSEILERCPAVMKRTLSAFQDQSVLLVTGHDLKLFSDIESGLEYESFKAVVPILFSKVFDKFRNNVPLKLTSIVPITNRIYYFLSKSLSDITEEIRSKAVKSSLVQFTSTGWTRTSDIEWKSPPSTLDSCLERQLELLLRMVNHFEPGSSTSHQRFPYKFKIFKNVEPSDKYRLAIKQANEAFRHKHDNNATVLPDELHVWICLLDDAIANVISKDLQNAQLLSCLLKLYMNFSLSGNMKMDTLETLRVITHNTVRLVAVAGSSISSQNVVNGEIFQKQIGYMNWATVEGKMSFLVYRDLVEVFAQYWRQHNEVIEGILTKVESDHFQQDLKDIQNLLLQCMREVLEKKAELPVLVHFCRVFDEFLTDFNDLPLDWFVRLKQKDYLDILVRKGMLTLVDNKWKDSEMQSYRVISVEKFEQFYMALENDGIPKHYMIQVVKDLLKCINSMAVKTVWSDDQSLTENDQINASSLLISAVRSSLMYLKEQPDYVSFDRFFEESTKSFHAVSSKSTSLSDFEKRMSFIKESFWFIRNQNSIDIDSALNLCSVSNDEKFNENYLKLGFHKYNEHFEEYISANADMLNEDKIKHIVNIVKSNVKELLSSEWAFDLKQNTLPVILAGLAAVWSLHVSKDVASTGHYLKPHCIQILCVLRLLSADKDSVGVKKHLAQVLTGQGKSLVLAFTTSVLVLFGHSVNILCYSEYLTQRDAQDFEEFYEYFAIQDCVSYHTFVMAVDKQLEQFMSDTENYILQCLGLPTKPACNPSVTPNQVLLVDEVDVFFSEIFYGNTYNRGVFPSIPGLGQIQVKIWEMAIARQTESSIRQGVETFLNTNDSPEIAEFNALLNKPGAYSLFERRSVSERYTNKSFFWKHLHQMITTAITVSNMTNDDSTIQRYRINAQGNITTRAAFGYYSEHIFYGYENTFIYFRLKRSNYDLRKPNCGYLNQSKVCISYAKLPETYPLILGVTGTLTSLNGYEKEAVQQHYQISESSVMPSFFGGSNLQFSESSNFTCQQTATSWMNSIFAQISATINANRSVLVIFDTDVTIESFKRQFASQLDRLNVLTIETESKEKKRIIDDAGVARTVTLATREMGRGVDYKSSVAVEKNGGIHVIQTFFSLDVKEETQIKGRTARKDNRGSYELIVCREDLEKLNLTTSSTVTYHLLDNLRQSMVNNNSETRRSELRDANERHANAIKFYKNVGIELYTK